MAEKKISSKPIAGGKQLHKGPFPVHISKGVSELRGRNLLSLPREPVKRKVTGKR